MEKKRLKIDFNSPVILSFSLLCLAALLLNKLTGGASNRLLFSVYRSPLTDPLTYVRFFGHVFGHAGWEHFIGNITLLLVIGPMLEEKYGSGTILSVMLVTAFVIGLVNWLFFPSVAVLGASGIVFSFILLSSFSGFKEGSIPATFIAVAVIYIGGELADSLFVKSDISYMAHIVGGLVGSFLGYRLGKKRNPTHQY